MNSCDNMLYYNLILGNIKQISFHERCEHVVAREKSKTHVKSSFWMLLARSFGSLTILGIHSRNVGDGDPTLRWAVRLPTGRHIHSYVYFENLFGNWRVGHFTRWFQLIYIRTSMDVNSRLRLPSIRRLNTDTAHP